jgi:hypothetical protein
MFEEKVEKMSNHDKAVYQTEGSSVKGLLLAAFITGVTLACGCKVVADKITQNAPTHKIK